MRRIPWWAIPPLVIVLAIAAYAISMVAGSDDVDAPSTIDIAASEPEYATVTELTAASDRVVVGVVTAIEPGRPITDPADPTVGVRTQLVSIDVERTAKGDAVETVVIEQEATLLDGTPITVNGVSPLKIGDAGRFYLVDGDGDQFPYAALTTVDGFVPGD